MDGLDAVRNGAARVADDGSPLRERGHFGASNRDADAAVCTQEARQLGDAMNMTHADMQPSLP